VDGVVVGGVGKRLAYKPGGVRKRREMSAWVEACKLSDPVGVYHDILE